MARVLQQISSVAGATILSRLLGLVRDVCVFAVLGAGLVNSAFVLAFTLPNLFRRLLGEGALTSAFVPVLTDTLEKEGRAAGWQAVNRLLTRLALVLCGLVALGSLVMWGLTTGEALEERWRYGTELSLILFPYVFFICLAALVSAALNVHGRFFIPAVTPVLLNLAMIAGLAAGALWAGQSPQDRVLWLCGGVLLGGALQLGLPWWALRREGWRPQPDLTASVATQEVWRLFLPGALGAAIFQINIVVSRFLAFGLNEAAAGILYLANRLVELPLGVFAISITTVFFPALAREASRGQTAAFAKTYDQALRLILVITLPASAGLVVLAEPILRALFEWGLFSSQAVERTVGPLRIFALGLPLYAWATLATRGLHSWKEMRLPVRLGIVNAVLNLVLSLLLLGPWQENGLAAANVLAAVVFVVLLERAVRQRVGAGSGVGQWWRDGLKILTAAVVMGLGVAGWYAGLASWLELPPKGLALLVVATGVPMGLGLYAGLTLFWRFPEWDLVRSRFRRSSEGSR